MSFAYRSEPTYRHESIRGYERSPGYSNAAAADLLPIRAGNIAIGLIRGATCHYSSRVCDCRKDKRNFPFHVSTSVK